MTTNKKKKAVALSKKIRSGHGTVECRAGKPEKPKPA